MIFKYFLFKRRGLDVSNLDISFCISPIHLGTSFVLNIILKTFSIIQHRCTSLPYVHICSSLNITLFILLFLGLFAFNFKSLLIGIVRLNWISLNIYTCTMLLRYFLSFFLVTVLYK